MLSVLLMEEAKTESEPKLSLGCKTLQFEGGKRKDTPIVGDVQKIQLKAIPVMRTMVKATTCSFAARIRGRPSASHPIIAFSTITSSDEERRTDQCRLQYSKLRRPQ
ncbi:MAG: hypothetical protein R2788_12200 [Saprospiraceae bacterium]